MRILVLGAGVQGSLYAARLHDAGHDVTILARGERLESIRRHGIVVRDVASHLVSTSLVPAIDRLAPDDRYDVALVFVRREQRTATLADLAANRTPSILFMGNDPIGAGDLAAALGPDRILLGFPGAGGTIEDGVVHVRLAGRALPTTIGELDGSESDRIRELAIVLRSAGFPTAVSGRIDAWLKTHAAVVVPVAAAVHAAGGDLRRAARTPDIVILTVRAIREGLAVLRALDVPITPEGYGRLMALPEPALRAYVARGFGTERARLMAAAHALRAREEMAALADDLHTLAARSGVPTPSFDRLTAHLEPTAEPIEEGSRTLVVRHPLRAVALGGASALAGLAVGLLVLRRFRPDLAARAPLARWPSPARMALGVRLMAVRLPAARLSAVRLPAVRLPVIGRLDGVRLPPTVPRLAALATLARSRPLTLGPPGYEVRRALMRFRRPGFWPYMRTPAE